MVERVLKPATYEVAFWTGEESEKQAVLNAYNSISPPTPVTSTAVTGGGDLRLLNSSSGEEMVVPEGMAVVAGPRWGDVVDLPGSPASNNLRSEADVDALFD